MSLIFISAALLSGQILPAWLHAGRFEYPPATVVVHRRKSGLADRPAQPCPAECYFVINRAANTFSLCLLYYILVTLVYSPVELVLLTNSAFIGRVISNAIVRSAKDQTSEDLVR